MTFDNLKKFLFISFIRPTRRKSQRRYTESNYQPTTPTKIFDKNIVVGLEFYVLTKRPKFKVAAYQDSQKEERAVKCL